MCVVRQVTLDVRATAVGSNLYQFGCSAPKAGDVVLDDSFSLVNSTHWEDPVAWDGDEWSIAQLDDFVHGEVHRLSHDKCTSGIRAPTPTGETTFLLQLASQDFRTVNSRTKAVPQYEFSFPNVESTNKRPTTEEQLSSRPAKHRRLDESSLWDVLPEVSLRRSDFIY